MKRYTVKWDETEIPDGVYVLASDCNAVATALEDCYAFARRSKHMTRGLAGERGWDQIIQFCERGGCKSSPLRSTDSGEANG